GIVHRVTPEGDEDYVLLPSPTDSVSYQVTLGTNVAGLRLVSRTLELLDSDGAPRLRIAPPFLVDSANQRHPAEIRVEGCAYDTDPTAPFGRALVRPGNESCLVRISWDDADVSYPALLDPNWSTTTAMA